MNSSQLSGSSADLSSPTKIGMMSSQGLGGAEVEVEWDPDNMRFVYICNVQGCGKRCGTKSMLSSHKRSSHWIYHECTICLEKEKGKDVYILDRKVDIKNHFQTFHPHIGRDIRDRFVRECSAKEDHQLVKTEKGVGASQSPSRGPNVNVPQTPRKEKKDIPTATGSDEQANKLDRLRSSLRKKDRKIEVLQSAVNCVEDDKQILDTKLTEKQEELDKVLLENEELREAICTKELDFKKLQEDHNTLQKLCVDLERQKVSLMTAQIGLPVDVERDYQEKVEQLQETLREYQYQINGYKNKERKMEANNAMLRDDNEHLRKQIDVVVERCKRRDQEIQENKLAMRGGVRVPHVHPPRPRPRPYFRNRNPITSTRYTSSKLINHDGVSNYYNNFSRGTRKLSTLDQAITAAAASSDGSQGRFSRPGYMELE